MKVEVSLGEAVDKLSILEIKIEKIKDETKKIEIQKEIDALTECEKYKNTLFYDLLLYVNEKIWDTTDQIKKITKHDTSFASLADAIFELNQKRFRIKNWYNLSDASSLKEQKSYDRVQCNVLIDDLSTFYDKLPVVYSICLDYDHVTIVSNFAETIQSVLNIPTVFYSETADVTEHSIDLKSYEIEKEMLRPFELKPIVYISGGLLGDFVHQLSVIQEVFLRTGRKGILYISNDMGGDNFRFGLEKTYQDTYKIVSTQKYISDYKIFKNEPFDINLSLWRYHNIEIPWNRIFFNNYHIEWGIHPWIIVPYDPVWKDTVLVTTNSYHSVRNIDFSKLYKEYGHMIKFIDLSEKETTLFKNTHEIENLVLYKPLDLYEMCVAIKSCKLFIGNYSSPLAFAYGMHTPSIVGMCSSDDVRHVGLEKIMPHLTICPDMNLLSDIIKEKCETP
jgi:hypothetical protein